MSLMSDIDFNHVIDLCQNLAEELWKVKGATLGEMIFALTVTMAEVMTLDGFPRAAQHFKTGMAKPLQWAGTNADQGRIDLCADAIIEFGKTLNESYLKDVPAICALCLTKVVEIAQSEAHGDSVRNLWMQTLKVMAAERLERQGRN
jgi:hypothetical protein